MELVGLVDPVAEEKGAVGGEGESDGSEADEADKPTEASGDASGNGVTDTPPEAAQRPTA